METLVSVLLISIVVVSVFSLALSSKVASRKTQRRAEALYYTRQAMEKLKAYITINPIKVDNAADPLFAAIGPGGSWSIPDDQCAGCTGGPGSCWALESMNDSVKPMQNCVHDVSNLLPVKLTGPGMGMKLYYIVTDSACDQGTCKKVEFHVSWADDIDK